MTTLGIISWAVLCFAALFGVYKELKQRTCVVSGLSIGSLIAIYSIPVIRFWENSSLINSIYILFLAILTVCFLLSCYPFKNKTFASFFLGVIITFLFLWEINALPFRPGWTPREEAFLEKYLGGPFHHSTLGPVVTLIILSCHQVFQRIPQRFKLDMCSPYLASIGRGVLVFLIISQIPEVFIYGTPWW